MKDRYDVIGIGNAIVDVIFASSDEFLLQHGIAKSVMTLIDEFRAVHLIAAAENAKESSGGSAANTMAGLASFGAKGAFVGKVKGDRLGSIFRISPSRQVETFATLPASVAAFHLAFGPDECLYIAAPTLASHDPIYRVRPDRVIEVACDGFGRPQGLAFDRAGMLYVAEALAGASGLYRVDVRAGSPTPELVVSAPMLVGVAMDPEGGLLLASNDTIWRLDVGLQPLALAPPPR